MIYIYPTSLRSKQRHMKLNSRAVVEAKQLQLIPCPFPAAVHTPPPTAAPREQKLKNGCPVNILFKHVSGELYSSMG